MIAYCHDQVAGASIVQEKSALANAPQRSSAEHIPGGNSLRDPIGKALPHVMYEDIRVQIDFAVGERR